MSNQIQRRYLDIELNECARNDEIRNDTDFNVYDMRSYQCSHQHSTIISTMMQRFWATFWRTLVPLNSAAPSVTEWQHIEYVCSIHIGALFFGPSSLLLLTRHVHRDIFSYHQFHQTKNSTESWLRVQLDDWMNGIAGVNKLVALQRLRFAFWLSFTAYG